MPRALIVLRPYRILLAVFMIPATFLVGLAVAVAEGEPAAVADLAVEVPSATGTATQLPPGGLPDSSPSTTTEAAESEATKTFLSQARAIRSLIQNKLEPTQIAQSLFDQALDAPEEAIQLERKRLSQLLGASLPSGAPGTDSAASAASSSQPTRAAHEKTAAEPESSPPLASPGAPSATGVGKQGNSPPLVGVIPATSSSSDPSKPQGRPTDSPDTEPSQREWEARLELDRARLEFYSLPRATRDDLLRSHQELHDKAISVKHDTAINAAEEEARVAEEKQRKALEAAQRATTEAARLVSEEHARLLAVTQAQAKFQGELIQRQAELADQAEASLAWRRRVGEIADSTAQGPAAGARADAAYVELRMTLVKVRAALSKALSTMGDGLKSVPQAPEDRLAELPPEVDQSVAVEERGRVTSRTIELLAAEEAFETEEAQQLMAQVEDLNRLRLTLLEKLSPDKRAKVLGFTQDGWNQATSEIWQVVLTLRFHLHTAYEWLAAIRSGSQRGQSAWVAFVLILKWAFPIGVFIWWRRRAELMLRQLRLRMREEFRNRRHQEGGFELEDYAEQTLSFVRRVRKPLEWVLLVSAVTWLMPEQMRLLLEVQLASTVLFWVFGGLFIVLAIDAISSQSGGRALQPKASVNPESPSLRLRSLRLVGRAVVGFGLPLSLSELLVGAGTVYAWVFSTCWFAAIPILLVIIAWWRPVIFERFSSMRKPNPFERWVLSRKSTPGNVLASVISSAAAVAGGIYLFVLGAVRVVRSRVLTLTWTRRLLAYLFRRDLSKKAQATQGAVFKPITGRTFDALGPEQTTKGVVASVADAQVEDVIRRIRRSGGGAIAIVGERGAGKTTLIERIQECGEELIRLRCTTDGLPALRAQLNAALEVPEDTPLEQAAIEVDGRSGDHAVLIDDAHYLVRPMMGGLAELDCVLPLFRAHSRSCCWILAFDETLWRFVERARGATPLFDDVIRLRPWDETAIVGLITHRNQLAELQPDFSELGLDLPANADEIDLFEAKRRTEANYYRLLWDYAAGNPGVALHFWRRSLGIGQQEQVFVRLFDAPDVSHLEELSDAAAFTLRAIIQLNWASAQEVQRVTDLPLAAVLDALRYGNQKGFFETDGERYRVNWDWFRAVTRFLQRRHLLFSAT